MLTGGTWPQLYPLLMGLAILTGVLLSRRWKSRLPLNRTQRVWIGMWAFSGAILGARLPFLIPGLPGFVAESHGPFVGGRTILLGMVGGYVGVESAKWWIGLKSKTGDAFVVPVAASIAVGRLACFAGGCCYGQPTDMPWGIVFPHVDSLPRHPIQLYEALFHASCTVLCGWCVRRQKLTFQVIKFYYLLYFTYRFGTEFLRPEIPIAWGLTAYQWLCLVLSLVFAGLWRWDARRTDQLAA